MYLLRNKYDGLTSQKKTLPEIVEMKVDIGPRCLNITREARNFHFNADLFV